MKMMNWNCITNVGGYSLVNGRRTTIKAQKAVFGQVCWEWSDLKEAEHEAMIRLKCFVAGIPRVEAIVEEEVEEDFFDIEELEELEELEEDF